MSFNIPQTVVDDRSEKVQGLFRKLDAVTAPRTADGATAIVAGQAVIASTADFDVILPVAAFTFAEFQGVVGLSRVDDEKALITGVKEYTANEALTLVREGRVAVFVDDTVAKDGAVWFVHTAGASALHTFRSDIDTAAASKIPAVYEEAGVAGDLVWIRISDGARTASL